MVSGIIYRADSHKLAFSENPYPKGKIVKIDGIANKILLLADIFEPYEKTK